MTLIPLTRLRDVFYTRHGATELNPRWLVWNDIKIVLDK
jgi:hypothetical protein